MVDVWSVLDANALLDAVSEDASMEAPNRPKFRELVTAVDRERLDEVTEGSGSGIRIESSTAFPTRAVSVVQLLSFTITCFDLCQHKLVTA